VFVSRLLFNPEDGSDVFLRIVGSIPADYVAFYPINSNPSLPRRSMNVFIITRLDGITAQIIATAHIPSTVPET
jgi:hypothetical protein